MKSRIFCIPPDSILEFAEIIGEYDLEGIILGVNNDEIELSVDYEPEEHSEAILSMIEHIENINAEQEDDED